LAISYSNNYFDFEDIDNPVKSYIDSPEYMYYPQSGKKTLFINIRKNRYSLNDNLVYGEEEESSFLSFENAKLLDQNPEGLGFTIDFKVDSQIDYYERKIFDFIEMSGILGGFFGTAKLVLGFLVGIYSKVSMNKHMKKYSESYIENYENQLEFLKTIAKIQSNKSANENKNKSEENQSPLNQSIEQVNGGSREEMKINFDEIKSKTTYRI
jgi:hypothetical protein